MSVVIVIIVLFVVQARHEHLGVATPMMRLNSSVVALAILSAVFIMSGAWSTGQDILFSFDGQHGIRKYLRSGICWRGAFYLDRHFVPVPLRNIVNIQFHQSSYAVSDGEGGTHMETQRRVPLIILGHTIFLLLTVLGF